MEDRSFSIAQAWTVVAAEHMAMAWPSVVAKALLATAAKGHRDILQACVSMEVECRRLENLKLKCQAATCHKRSWWQHE